MTTKGVPGDSRVQVVTKEMLRRDALTIRCPEDGTDLRLFASEDDEGNGLPLRTDDEIGVDEEEGWTQFANADGIWVETETSSAGQIVVFKGVSVRRAPRRDVRVEATVSSNTYPTGASFDTADGATYPISLSNGGGTIEVVELSIVEGEVNVEIETSGGDTVTLPVAQSASIDSFSCDSVTIKDGGTTPRVAGGWAGE